MNNLINKLIQEKQECDGCNNDTVTSKLIKECVVQV